MKNDHTTSPRRCSECGQPLPPQAGRGRPQRACADDVSPDGWCRRRRKHRLDNARRLHRFVAAHTPADLVAGAVTVADVMLDYDGEAPTSLRGILGDAGFSLTEQDATSSAFAVSAWEQQQRDEKRFEAEHGEALRRLAHAEKERLVRDFEALPEAERGERVRRRVAERMARAQRNPA